MPTQGVLYIKWGTKTDALLTRSHLSLRTMHPDWDIHVAELPPDSTMLDKSRMMDLSPFDETLYLDADTVILDRLDFGFAKARRFGLACCISEVPWARRFSGLADQGDLVEYNAGMMFFSKEKMRPLFDQWKQLCFAPGRDTRLCFFDGTGIQTMQINDQGLFSKAIDELGICPFVLPMNWNFRPLWQKSFFGPLKIWHDYADVPEAVRRFSAEQLRAGVVIQGLQL